MKIFISWSGKKSEKVGKDLQPALRLLLKADVWMSEIDLRAGDQWEKEIKRQLRQAQCCVVCLTKENLNSPWILFEAGFVASSPKKIVCPYLIDLSQSDIKNSPLFNYQYRQRDREGTWKLISDINDKMRALREKDYLEERYLREGFDNIWPSLEQKLNNLPDEEIITESMIAESKKAVESLSDKPGPVASKKSPTKIWLFNTSYYRRTGHISTPYQPIYKATGIHPGELIVRDEHGDILASQVDDFDPQDVTKATLVFSLQKEISPVKEDLSTPSSYVTIEKGTIEKRLNEPQLEIVGMNGQEERVYLSNNRLNICLELYPEPLKDDRPWYSGSVTSVRLDGWEILDAFNALLDLRDNETRCMQLDHLQAFYENGVPIQHTGPNLIRGHYQIISKSTGPVRARVTIASRPFYDSYSGSQSFRLYRVISLYDDTPYLSEKLNVVGTQQGRDNGFPCHFSTRYFSYIEMGLYPHIFEAKLKNPDDKPKYFAISFKSSPYQAYGFASDVGIEKISYPHPRFPNPQTMHRTFSWELSTSMAPRCLHLFSRGTEDIEVQIRKVWHEVVDNPLVAMFQT